MKGHCCANDDSFKILITVLNAYIASYRYLCELRASSDSSMYWIRPKYSSWEAWI
jgi:hypothetical protein